MGVPSCVRTFASDHMKYTMRIERLWVGRLFAFMADFRLGLLGHPLAGI